MNTDLHTIRTAGKKELPNGTAITMRLGSIPGTVNVSIQLPGQKKQTDLGDLRIIDGIVELPVNLVFFSYAREDKGKVVDIADQLWQEGFLTWVDIKDLLPGDNWKIQIMDAIERADRVIVFLSSTSVSKTGYVQKELKYALEQLDLRPSGHRYIIPVLLESCVPPRELQDIQWIRIWEDGAYEILLRALRD